MIALKNTAEKLRHEMKLMRNIGRAKLERDNSQSGASSSGSDAAAGIEQKLTIHQNLGNASTDLSTKNED